MPNLRNPILAMPMLRYALLVVAGVVTADTCSASFSTHRWLIAAAAVIAVALVTMRRLPQVSNVFTLLSVAALGGVCSSLATQDQDALLSHMPYGREAVTLHDVPIVVTSSPSRHNKVWMFEAVVCRNATTAVPHDGEEAPAGRAGGCHSNAEAAVRHILEGRKVRVSMMYDSLAPASRKPLLGASLAATMRVAHLNELRDAGFDLSYIRYLRSHNIIATAFIASGKSRETGSLRHLLPIWTRARLRLHLLRQSMTEQLASLGMAPGTTAVVSAMTLGVKDSLPTSLRQDYSTAGASHILALSGMHLATLFMFLTFFMRRRKPYTSCLVLAVMWTYVVFTGMSPSVVRAASMLSLYEVMTLASHKQHPLNILGAALLLSTVLSPESVWDIGFQLSYLAVFSIHLFSKPLTGWLMPEWRPSSTFYFRAMTMMSESDETPSGIAGTQKRRRKKRSKRWMARYVMTEAQEALKRVRDYIVGIVIVSIAAQLGTLPLTAYYFGIIPLAFIITNIIVLPLSGVIIFLSCILYMTMGLSSLTGGVLSLLTCIPLYPLRFAVEMQNTLLSAVASVPYSAIAGISVSPLQVLSLYVIVFIALRFLMMHGYRIGSETEKHDDGLA